MGGFKAPAASWSLTPERFPGALDGLVAWAIQAFGSGKFNSTFSFLFGVGLTIQMARAEAKGVPFVGLYFRRLAVLLALGLAHSIFLWDGDVLQIYAVNGLALLLIRKWPTRWVVALALVLLLAPSLRQAIRVYRQDPLATTRRTTRRNSPSSSGSTARGLTPTRSATGSRRSASITSTTSTSGSTPRWA